jgi:hypothetical protein
MLVATFQIYLHYHIQNGTAIYPASYKKEEEFASPGVKMKWTHICFNDEAQVM